MAEEEGMMVTDACAICGGPGGVHMLVTVGGAPAMVCVCSACVLKAVEKYLEGKVQ